MRKLTLKLEPYWQPPGCVGWMGYNLWRVYGTMPDGVLYEWWFKEWSDAWRYVWTGKA